MTLAGPKAGEVEVLARGIWPRWSPTDDRLAFVGRRDANWDIYLRSGDGLGLSRLTDDPALDTQPCWGPRRTERRLPLRPGQPLGPLPGRHRGPRPRDPADQPRPTRRQRLAQPRRPVRGLRRRPRPRRWLDPDPQPRPGDRPPLPRAPRRGSRPRLVPRRPVHRLHQPKARPAALHGGGAAIEIGISDFRFQISDFRFQISEQKRSKDRRLSISDKYSSEI